MSWFRAQPLQHVGAERSRRGDGERALANENRRRAQDRERLPAALGGRPVENQHAVEMVELVLGDARAGLRARTGPRCPRGRSPRR